MTSRSGGRSSAALIGAARQPAPASRPRGEPRRKLQRGDQARRIGLAGAGDVEGGAVIGRGAHERQAERDVDGVVEGQRLDRDQRLVVIHAQRGVVGLARAASWNIVSAGSGPRASMPSAMSRSIAGATIALSSLPSVPSSPACGLRPATASRGLRDAEALGQVARHHPPGLEDQVARQPLRHLLERDMDRDRHHGHLGRPQHHHRPGRIAGLLERQPGEIFGVARIGEAGLVEHALGDRIGHDRARRARRSRRRRRDRSRRSRRARWWRPAGRARRSRACRAAPPARRGRTRRGGSRRRPSSIGTSRPSRAARAAGIAGRPRT